LAIISAEATEGTATTAEASKDFPLHSELLQSLVEVTGPTLDQDALHCLMIVA